MGVGTVQLQVLGRDDVDRVNSGQQVVRDHDKTVVVQARTGDVLARTLGKQKPQRLLDLIDKSLATRDQVTGGHGVVLGLGHEVGGHDGRVGGLVGEHADLGRAGDHVDADVAGHVALGGRHVGVARAHDLVAGRDGLGAVGDRGDGLGAADGVDLVDAGDCGGGEGVGAQGPVCLGRRDHGHATHAGHLGGDDVHHDGGGILGTAARHVDRDTVQGRDLHAQHGAVGAGGKPGLLALALVEVAHLVAGALTGDHEGGVHLAQGGVHELGRHLEAGGREPVKALAVGTDGGVTIGAHVVHDGLRGLLDLARQGAGAAQVLVGELLCLVQGYGAHGSSPP